MYEYGRFIAYKEYGFCAIEQDIFPKDMIINMFGNSGIEIYYLLENITNYQEFKMNLSKIQIKILEMKIGFEKFKCKNIISSMCSKKL